MFKFNFQPDAAVEAESALPEDEVHLLASEEVAFNSKVGVWPPFPATEPARTPSIHFVAVVLFTNAELYHS